MRGQGQQYPHYPSHTQYASSSAHAAPPAQWQSNQLGHPTGHVHHGRHQQVDDYQIRLKDEQRRKQVAYAQALADQVRLREQQKLADREAKRRQDEADLAAMQHQQPLNAKLDYHNRYQSRHGESVAETGNPTRVERGLFDGLGQNGHHRQQLHDRGHTGHQVRQAGAVFPQPPAQYGDPTVSVAPPGMLPPSTTLHQHVNHENIHQISHWAEQPSEVGNTGHADPGHYHAHGLPNFSAGSNPELVSINHQNPSDRFPHHEEVSTYQPIGARRIKTDLHPDEDQNRVRLRHHQQQEIQDSLRKQIEEKNRQKLEEKRRREAEERQEMEKFQHEQRRQHAEEERAKEERRRRALVEEEQARLKQQQVLVAAAAAAEELRRERHQRHQHHVSNHPRIEPYSDHAVNQVQKINSQSVQPSAGGQFTPSESKKTSHHEQNPFINSRAHLFDEPPPQQAPTPVQRHTTQTYYGQTSLQNSIGRTEVDARTLLQQYERVQEELHRQRELVERLQEQLQQQQQARFRKDDIDGIPTVSDLERLRDELREELELREEQHRKEIERLLHQIPQPDHPSKLSHNLVHTQHLPHAQDQLKAQNRNRQGRITPFAQDALDEDNNIEDEHVNLPETTFGQSVNMISPFHHTNQLHHSNDQVSTVCADKKVSSPKYESRETISQDNTKQSQVQQNSLFCESKLVFFDGRVEESPVSRSRQLSALQAPNPSKLADDDRNSLQEEHDPIEYGERSTEFFVVRNARDVEGVNTELSASRYLLRADITSKMRSSREFVPQTAHASAKKAPDLVIHEPRTFYGSDCDDDDDEDDDESWTGEKLEAIFQRNLRRHDILTGFEARVHGATHTITSGLDMDPRRELQDLLGTIPTGVTSRETQSRGQEEPSLITSTRWFASSVLRQSR